MSYTHAVRRAVSWLPVIAIFAAGCRDNAVTNPVDDEQGLPAAEDREIASPSTGNLLSSAPVSAICGPTVTYKLTDLRNTIGTVMVTNDAENVIVTYNVTSKNWYLTQTRLAVVKSLLKVPQDEKKTPKPWSFPFATDHDPAVKTYTYSVSLQSLNVAAGDNVIVAAMAGVVRPKNENNRSGKWDWTVMWGLGNFSGRSIATLHNYTIAKCEGAPPQPPTIGGVVTLTFDDGFRTTFDNAYPVLKKYELKANIAVNPEPIDGLYSDYMTMAHLKALKGEGWSIVSHSYTHPDLTTLSPDSLDKELKNSQKWVKDNGFGPTSVFIVPFHSWDVREREAIAKYYKYVRGYTVNQFWPARYQPWPTTAPLDLTGYEPEYAPYTTPEGRQATMEIVKTAVDDGDFVDIFFHRVPTADLPAFELLIKEIATYKANVRTWGQLVQ